jgi:hypothetical protein
MGRDPWQFAVEVAAIAASGLGVSDVRWLIGNGHVRHAVETTRPDGPERTFQSAANLALFERSCLVLHPSAVALARKATARPAGVNDPAAVTERPYWDAGAHTLYWRGRVVKRYLREAPYQELMLQTFQDRHWLRCVHVQLPEDAVNDFDEWLNNTVKNLDRTTRRHLRFRRERACVAWSTARRRRSLAAAREGGPGQEEDRVVDRITAPASPQPVCQAGVQTFLPA